MTAPQTPAPHTPIRCVTVEGLLESHAVLECWAELAGIVGPAGILPGVCGMSGSYQDRQDQWLIACFGEEIARDKTERNHRFLEEALELAQACNCTPGEAHQLVDYVFGRPVGDPAQEVGGVMNTLAALCTAADIDLMRAAEVELTRCWGKVEAIRAKHRTKPKYGPLPGATP